VGYSHRPPRTDLVANDSRYTASHTYTGIVERSTQSLAYLVNDGPTSRAPGNFRLGLMPPHARGGEEVAQGARGVGKGVGERLAEGAGICLSACCCYITNLG